MEDENRFRMGQPPLIVNVPRESIRNAPPPTPAVVVKGKKASKPSRAAKTAKAPKPKKAAKPAKKAKPAKAKKKK